MSILTTGLLALAAAGQAVVAQNNSNNVVEIDIPSDLAPRRLLPDVYGYSIEPIWVDAFVATPKAARLLQAIKDVTGTPPPIRVGGNTADQTYIFPHLNGTNGSSAALPELPDASRLEITPAWFRTWGRGYFPEGTELIYTLNLMANASAWDNAVAQAEAAWRALGDDLVMFELGNEIDHFINKHWRAPGWGVDQYIEQFRNLTGQIASSDWYRAAGDAAPLFQAGVIADPPWVPDQQDEIDDFNIRNLTADGTGGIVERPEDRRLIGSYATHLYPQSTCDPGRWVRMRLDLLSDHATLWKNVSQYAPEAAAAQRAGAPLVMGETNSVSCGGRSGISDTFGAALWSVDYVLTDATIGVEKTYFHLGGQSEYSAFTPAPYRYKNESLEAGIRANWYAHYFVAKVVARDDDDDQELSVSGIPAANSSSLSGFAVYSGPKETEEESESENEEKKAGKTLRKLVFLDMGVWNGTQGLSNPSTLSVTDNDDPAFQSQGSRPSTTLRIATPWCPGSSVAVAARLSAPGTNAKSGVSVSGVTFDPESGEKVNDEEEETLKVGEDGTVEVKVERAHAVLLEASDDALACAGSGSGSGEDVEEVGESAAVSVRATSAWLGLVATFCAGLTLAL